MQWKSCFESDCKELSSKFIWANKLPDIIKNFQGLKDEYFQSQLPKTIYKSNSTFLLLLFDMYF